MNPKTDRPNHASAHPVNSFHERYNSDSEFKRQVDEGRRRSAQERSTAAFQKALDITQRKGKKIY